MSVLPKGTLTVVVATVVTSTLILMSGNSVVADSVDKTIKEASSEISFKESVAATNEVVKTISKDNGGVLISLPPPGPFTVADPDDKGIKLIKDSVSSLLEPTLQKEIIKKPTFTISKPGVKEAPLNNRTEAIQATLTSVAPEFKRAQPSIPMGPVDSHLAPILKKIAPEEPKRKVLNLTQKEKTLETPVQPKRLTISNTQPIWMKKPPVNTSARPRQPSAGRLIKQQYMYVPVPMYQPNYLYPQMLPAYGNYYYPPVGNFRMPQFNSGVNNGVQPKRSNIQKLNKDVVK